MSTLTELRTRAIRLADMPGHGDSYFIETAELDEYVNDALAELHATIESVLEDYFLQPPTSFTLTTSNTYTLPASVYKVRGIDYQTGGRWRPLTRATWGERYRWEREALAADGFPNRAYMLTETSVYMMPETSPSGTYRLWYDRTFTKLVNAGDTIALPNDWEQFVALHAARTCMAKEQSDIREISDRIERTRARIATLAASRDLGPMRIADVREEWT